MKKNIKYLIMDVDGTLTDGSIYVSDNGELFKSFNVKDGYAICNILPQKGIMPIIITGRDSKIVAKRCEELRITHVYQGVKEKIEILSKFCIENHCDYSNIAYIGDDINDFECMNIIKENGGIVGCPADAVKKIIDMSDYVAKKNGGCGALREFVEWIID